MSINAMQIDIMNDKKSKKEKSLSDHLIHGSQIDHHHQSEQGKHPGSKMFRQQKPHLGFSYI